MASKKNRPTAVDVEMDQIDALNPTSEERDLGTYDAIVAAREAEKQKLLARLTPPQPEKKIDTANLIGKFIEKALAPSDGLLAAERAECERIARPMLSEARSIQTAFGILKSKWQEKVQGYAGTDWSALRAATPTYLVWEPKLHYGTGGNVDIAKQAVHNFQVAVTNARAALASTFGDAQPGPREVNSVSLQHAATILEDFLVGDNYISDKSWEGSTVRVLSANFRRATVQLDWWLQRARMVLQSAERAVERFIETERTLTDILAKLDPAEVAPQMKPTSLPKLEEPPVRGTSSYVDFDPRESA